MKQKMRIGKISLVVVSSLFLVTCFSCRTKKSADVLDIAGKWSIQLDSTNIGLEKGWNNTTFEQEISLPGTTDDAGIGVPNTLEAKLEKPQLLHLIRKNSYIGAAWYTKEIAIPQNWEKKILTMSLERVIWQTNVWIDGVEVTQFQNSLIAPHVYDLTQYLVPGKTQRITIRVDNTKKFDSSVRNLAHAYTDETQIIWNGIIGNMFIEAVDQISISEIKITPNITTNKALVQVYIQNLSAAKEPGKIELQAVLKGSSQKVAALNEEVTIKEGKTMVEFEYDMGKEVKLWSEYNPGVYEMQVSLQAGSNNSYKTADFGMRAFERKGSTLTINGNPVFLRGTLECNIFPLEGHPPMKQDGWKKVFGTAKNWGLNHIRFHSWCPPKAAFEAADQLGMYLQVELPAWTLTIGQDEATTRYLYAEADRMIKEYGNHPSFCMWSMGNELEGDMSVLKEMVKDLKEQDSRHLYTITSFTFEKGFGAWPEAEDDFFITQWTNKGWVRGQGVFNSEYPSFDKDYSKAVEGMEVPLITHEIGQYAVYPNMNEIAKYTGVLLPLNFMAIRNDLEKKGLLDKAADYTMASGKLAAILYKEEIERAIKTPGISGFQLLDLHDFSGQGTALVGLLDAFWDSKGVTTPEEFKYSCNGIVPLIRFPKATYRSNENFEATIDVSNYADKQLEKHLVEWEIVNKEKVMETGSFNVDLQVGYNSALGKIDVSLSGIKEAAKLEVRVKIKNTSYQNQWDIWVYPQTEPAVFGKVKYTRSLSEAYQLLSKGETVLLNPDWKTIKGIEGKFVPVFWSPVHFPKQAASMGMLCNPGHKAFDKFPTDMHTNWQWWDLNINSTTMIVDSIQGGTSIVDIIDNFVNNRRLSMIYEGKVGEGKLLLASCDLHTDLENRMVANQMLISLLGYMNSSAFEPKLISNPEILNQVLAKDQVLKQDATSVY